MSKVLLVAQMQLRGCSGCFEGVEGSGSCLALVNVKAEGLHYLPLFERHSHHRG